MVGVMRGKEDGMGNDKVWRVDEMQVRGVEKAKQEECRNE